MKAIMVMFDTLNRRMLPPYGCDWVHAPNFERLAKRTVTFDTCYAGSLPCMPARRELHTGRYNFLHRSWGPIEPFDDSMPSILKHNGVHSHLISDHYHYWEDGGCTYHPRYKTWEIERGQEGDPWKAHLPHIDIPETVDGRGGDWFRQDRVNRLYMQREEDFCQARTVSRALEFIETNREEDKWFLHVETFDPHEPYFAPQKYRDMYKDNYAGKPFDWPPYRRIEETPAEIAHLRNEVAALTSFCDAQLGRILDFMDAHDLWEDTMLIVNTDHGFLLSEHDWWGKVVMPFYQEIVHTPLFIWDPRCGRQDARCPALVQTIDLAPTVLEYFGVDRTSGMQGTPLRDTVASDAPVREAALFGIHGGHVNVTDGRHVYMRAPNGDNQPLYNYTLMPTHMKNMFSLEELRTAEIAPPFSFTKDTPTMRTRGRRWAGSREPMATMLFDVENDPQQLAPLEEPAVEARMIEHLRALMAWNDAPAEQYERLGVVPPDGA